jgi:dienelactone hydrolase
MKKIFVAMGLLCGFALAQENDFRLMLHGKEIGAAHWSEEGKNGGHSLHCVYNFKLPNVANFDVDQTANYDAQWQFSGAVVSASVNSNKQPQLTIVTDIASKKASFRAQVGQMSKELNSIDLKPHAVLFNDFDPSGIEALVRMAATAKATTFPFQALLAKGTGQQAEGTLKNVADAKATLSSQPITVKQYVATIGSVMMDVFADPQGHLMRAAISSQGVEYVREGFALQAPELPEGVQQVETTFRSSGSDLPGTIAAPTKGKPIAAVVLVHGSGPHDRDESLGPNRPFRDLAWGMAQNGIVSLRYDKRTMVAPETLASNPTIDGEVVNDAVAALRHLHAQDEMKDLPLFIVGHSVGANMAPFIVAKAREGGLPIAGEILLAGSARRIDQISADQVRTLTPPEQRDAAIEKNKQMFASVRNPETPDTQTIAGAPASYWRDWLAHDTAAELQKVNVPTLALLGEKDFQTTKADFDSLIAAGGKNVTAKMFPDLNHLFMPSHTIGTADYSNPEHVSDEVVRTIADWIRQHATAVEGCSGDCPPARKPSASNAPK